MTDYFDLHADKNTLDTVSVLGLAHQSIILKTLLRCPKGTSWRKERVSRS